MLASALLSNSPLRNTHDTAVSSAATTRPSAVMAEEWLAKLVVAADATFCKKNPTRASRSAAQPLSECERHCVQPQVVAQLMGEHAAQFVTRKCLDRIRGDHDEVPAAGERIQVVRWQHGEHVPVGRSVDHLQHGAPRRSQHGLLVAGGAACPEQGREHMELHRPQEQEDHRGHVPGGERPERNLPDQLHREPENEGRQQPDREHRHHRCERGDGR